MMYELTKRIPASCSTMRWGYLMPRQSEKVDLKFGSLMKNAYLRAQNVKR